MDEPTLTPAAELAALVRSGRLGATELLEATLRRIEAVDPGVCAFAEIDAEGALEQARSVERGDQRPFAGVPIAVKGNIAVEGRLFELGSRALAGNRMGHDAFLVRRLREAGFVIVGITRLPEFGILPTTEPRHGGPVRNPWDADRTPGGSSGGAAAAVAAGMLPIAHGNDGGGSIRIPAACCGLVGLKPSRGRVSRGPELGESMLGVDGVLARTVADTALAVDVLGGYEVGDATWAPRPAEPYALAMQRRPRSLRIAVTSENSFGFPVHPENERALRETAQELESLGHVVEEATPRLPGPEALDLFTSVFAPHISLGVAFAAAVRGGDLGPDDVEPLSRGMLERATATTALEYQVAITRLQQISREVVSFWAGYDLLLTPVLAERPLPVGELNGDEADPRAALERAARFTPYTALFNVTGQPAISLPAGIGTDGLPSAVQLVAAPLGEDLLLQVAAQLEAARPWSGQLAPVATAPAHA